MPTETTTDRAEGQAWLAEHVSAPYTVDYPKGSKRWLLRRECGDGFQPSSGVSWMCLGVRCTCAGLGYVYNDAEDALTEAIRAKGWNVRIHIRADDGDWVQIFSPITLEVLSRVYVQEGLRGRHAIEVALKRAEESQNVQ